MKANTNTGILVLFSGGADSRLLLDLAATPGRRVVALHFEYTHPAAAHEVAAVRTAVVRLGISGRDITLLRMPLPIHDARALALGEMEAGPRVVAGRNQIMISVAVNVAASMGLGAVWFGATSSDLERYPDCRRNFITTMDRLATPWKVRVLAPLAGWYRRGVIHELEARGIPASDYWSCYQPVKGKPCGACDSCRQDQ